MSSPIDLARRHADAAQRFRAAGDHPNARASLLRALAALDDRPEHARPTADLLYGLAEVSMDEGRPDLAREPLEESLRRHQELATGPSADVALALSGLGAVYEMLGLLDLSERSRLRATEIDRQLEADTDESFDQMMRGEFATALINLHRQLAAAEPDSIDEAYIAGDLGQAYFELQRMDEAEQHQRRAIDIRRRRQPGSLPLAIALSNLAATLNAPGRLDEADTTLGEAIEIAERVAPQSNALAAMRGTRLMLMVGQERYREVIEQAGHAIASAPEANRHLAGIYLAAALAHDSVGDRVRARELLEEGRDRCVLVSPVLSELTPLLMMLGWLNYFDDDLYGAAVAFDQAIRVAESRRPGAAAEPGLELRFGTAEPAYHGRLLVAWRQNDAEAAFHASESFRARTLAELLSDAGEPPLLSDAGEPHVSPALDAARERLGAAYRDPARAHLRAGLEQEVERLRVLLPGPTPDTPGPCTIAEVRDALAPDVTVASFEATADGIFAFVLSKRRFVFTRIEAEAEEVEAASAELLDACRARGSAVPEAALRQLGEWLLRPLASVTGRLVISANGPLAYLPFEALPLDGVPLAERCTVSSAPSATTLVRLGNRRPRPPHRPFAGFAVSHTPGQDPLPDAGRELREIAALFPGAIALYDDQVTTESIQDASTGARYVHLAMHGLIDDQRPLYSGFPLTGDRFLHAFQLAGFTLDADLVVCSACDTAVGATRPGEGIVGLAYSLFQAGATGVLISRWPVNDLVTRRMMVRFYGLLATGTPADEALRTAAAEVRKRHPHPREWAAFQLLSLRI